MNTLLASFFKHDFLTYGYSILPVRREILLGVLYCDLIGFHTYDYARHFLSSCTRILGFPTMPNGVEFEGRLAHVGTFPIGIEPSSFIDVSLQHYMRTPPFVDTIFQS